MVGSGGGDRNRHLLEPKKRIPPKTASLDGLTLGLEAGLIICGDFNTNFLLFLAK